MIYTFNYFNTYNKRPVAWIPFILNGGNLRIYRTIREKNYNVRKKTLMHVYNYTFLVLDSKTTRPRCLIVK
jgi:hypothetical protein